MVDTINWPTTIEMDTTTVMPSWEEVTMMLVTPELLLSVLELEMDCNPTVIVPQFVFTKHCAYCTKSLTP